MLDRRLTLVLGIALVVATVSGFGVLHLLQAAQAEARPTMATMLVARAALPEGHRIVAEDLEPREVPSAALPSDAVASPEAVLGRITRVAIYAGEAIVPGRLAPEGAAAGLAVRIAAGKRAMAVRLDEESGQAGLVQPDSRVDVLVTVGDSYGGPPVSRVIMHNMRVLAVGAESAAESPVAAIASTITLEVTPAQAERLAVAANQGRLQVMLRGFGDPDTARTAGASLGDMLPEVARAIASARAASVAGAAAVASSPARVPAATSFAGASIGGETPAIAIPDSTVVRVYRGAERTDQRFARRDSTKVRP
jgi:pilus assembly protein CpaB